MQFAIISALALAAGMVSADCQCRHNNDAGRWVDSTKSPSEAVDATPIGQCYKAETQGDICIQGGTQDDYNCLKEFAAAQQSYHGDWFLWTAINCGDLSMTMTQ